jgi:hypothetical protein
MPQVSISDIVGLRRSTDVLRQIEKQSSDPCHYDPVQQIHRIDFSVGLSILAKCTDDKPTERIPPQFHAPTSSVFTHTFHYGQLVGFVSGCCRISCW